MKKDLSICVIIPTLNRIDTLKETLVSLFNSNYIPDQLIIVDQTDDVVSRERIKQLLLDYKDKSEVRYLYQSHPSSTEARNTGMNYCKCDIMVFSDDDITVEKNTLNNLSDIFSDDKIAMVAGQDSNVIGKKRSKMGYLFGKKSFSKRNEGHVTKSVLGRFPDTKIVGTVNTEWAMGFFFAVRSKLVKEWNIKFDTKLTSYAYAEDLDFSYSFYKKAKKNHLRCVISDSVIVDHRASKEWRVPSRKSTMMYVINRQYLCYKHKMGLSSQIAMRWCNLGDWFERVIHKKNAKDIMVAQRRADKHLKEIKNGKLDEKLYI